MTNQDADAAISAEKVSGARKPPAEATPTSNGDVLPAKDAGVHAAQQENHKPKRKIVRKRPTPAEEPATEPAPEEPEPEEETQPGGRRRRGAAKV